MPLSVAMLDVDYIMSPSKKTELIY